MTVEMTCPTCGSHEISKNGTEYHRHWPPNNGRNCPSNRVP